MKIESSNKYVILLICAISALILSPLWHYEYHRDELLFLSYGNHLAMGYYSTPPLMGLLSFIILHLPIDTYITIRIIGMISFFLLLLYSTKLIKLFSNSLVLQIFTVLVMILAQQKETLMYLVTGFDTVVTTIASYHLLRFLLQHNKKDIILFAVLLGIGINNKYTILFFFTILLILLFYKKQMPLNAKEIKIAGIILLAFIIPNFFWQIKHDFMFMKYVSHVQTNQTKGANRIALLFKMLFSNELGFIFIVLGIWEMFKKNLTTKLFAIAALCCMLFVSVVKGKSYYCNNFFPLIYCFGILKLYDLKTTQKTKQIASAGVLLLLIPHFLCESFILTPKGLLNYSQFLRKHVSSNILKYEGGSSQNSKNILPHTHANMLGWNALVKEISNSCNKYNSDSIYIFCQNYGEAAAVEIIGKKYNLPSPLSFHDNFYYWSCKRIIKQPAVMLIVSKNGYSQNLAQLFRNSTNYVFKDDYAVEDMAGIYVFTNPSHSFAEYWQYILPKIDNPSAAYIL